MSQLTQHIQAKRKTRKSKARLSPLGNGKVARPLKSRSAFGWFAFLYTLMQTAVRAKSNQVATKSKRRFGDQSALYAAVHEKVLAIAKKVGRRSARRIQRATDFRDWAQEAMLALWRETRREAGFRFRDGVEVEKFVRGILRRQVAKAARDTMPLTPSGGDDPPGRELTPDQVLMNEHEESEIAALRDKVEREIRNGQAAVNRYLRRRPEGEQKSLRAWLRGATLEQSYLAGAMTLATVRKAIAQLLGGHLRDRIGRIRELLKELHHKSPRVAAGLSLGILKRPFKKICRVRARKTGAASNSSRRRKGNATSHAGDGHEGEQESAGGVDHHQGTGAEGIQGG